MWILPKVDGADAVSSVCWAFLCAFGRIRIPGGYWMQVAGVVAMPSICWPSRAFDCPDILNKDLLRKCIMGHLEMFIL